MAPGLQSPDAAPKVSRAEALATFGEKNSLVKKADIKAAADLLALRQKTAKVDEQGDWGRKSLDRFEQKRQADRWSASMAKDDIKAFKDKGTQKEAQKKIQDVQKVMATLDIITQDPTKMAARLAELQKNGVVAAGVTLPTLMAETGLILANDPSIAVQLEGMPEAERSSFIINALLKPQSPGAQELSSILAVRMGELHASIVALSKSGGQEASVQAQLEVAQKTKDVSMKAMGEFFDRKLVAGGKAKLTTPQRARLESILENTDDKSRRQEMANLTAELLGVAPADLPKVTEYVDNTNRVAVLNREIGTLNPQDATNPAFVVRDAERTALTARNGTLGVNDASPEVQTYREGLRMMSDVEFSTAERKYQDAHKSEATLALDAKIAGGVDIDRLNAENDVLRRMDSLFGEAFFQVVDERTIALREAKELDLEQKAKLAAEKGEKAQADGLITLSKKTKARRIEAIADAKGKITDHVHIKELSADMRISGYYGADGIKLMIARDLGYITQAEIDALAISGGKVPVELLNEKVFNDPDKKATFDAICTTEYSKSYRDSLMTDYFTAQRYMQEGIMGYAWRAGRGITIDGDMKDRLNFQLRENEWVRLYNNFGEDIQESLSQSREAQSFLDTLKAQGIVPEGKSKFLIYLLMMLLGVGSIATGSAPVALGGLTAAGLGAGANAKFNASGQA